MMFCLTFRHDADVDDACVLICFAYDAHEISTTTMMKMIALNYSKLKVIQATLAFPHHSSVQV